VLLIPDKEADMLYYFNPQLWCSETNEARQLKGDQFLYSCKKD